MKKNLNFIKGLLGPGAEYLDVTGIVKRDLLTDKVANLRTREQKQLAELAKLEKQLQQEQAAGARKREVAAHRAAAAVLEAARAEAEWNKQFNNLQLHMERALDRVAERQAAHRERLHQAGMAAAPKGLGGSSGGSEGLGKLTSQIAAQTRAFSI